MKPSSIGFRISVSSVLITLCFNLAYAGGDEPNEFEDRYQPNQREICEMYASANILNQFEMCKSVKIFEPIIMANISDKVEKVELSKEEFPDWPFNDVYFENRVSDQGVKTPIFYIEGQGNYELIDVIKQGFTVKSAKIGYIDNVIILQTVEGLGGVHTWHRQIVFSPHSCKGYEGYGDETHYNLSQTFSWSEAFANEIYVKTFFSPALCN